MRALFMGTPALAVPSLEALVEVMGSENVFVVSQPDKPAGRGLVLSPTPVKARALELGLAVHQPTKMKDGSFASWIQEREIDLALVVAYGRILPRAVLDAPKQGCFNVHASKLPKYRGAAPIAWAIIHGELQTAVDLMQMDEGLDTGPVLAERILEIGANETSFELGQRIGVEAGHLVRTSLLDAANGKLTAVPQDHANASFAPMLEKSHGVLRWSNPAQTLHNLVRGLQPWPVATTMLPSGKTLRVVRTELVAGTVHSNVARAPGVVIAADRGVVLVACGPQGQETVSLLNVQLEGKKMTQATDLVNGRVLKAGDVLG